jgi:hypothetical protein
MPKTSPDFPFVMALLQKLVAFRRFFASLNGALYMVQNMVSNVIDVPVADFVLKYLDWFERREWNWFVRARARAE